MFLPLRHRSNPRPGKDSTTRLHLQPQSITENYFDQIPHVHKSQWFSQTYPVPWQFLLFHAALIFNSMTSPCSYPTTSQLFCFIHFLLIFPLACQSLSPIQISTNATNIFSVWKFSQFYIPLRCLSVLLLCWFIFGSSVLLHCVSVLMAGRHCFLSYGFVAQIR